MWLTLEAGKMNRIARSDWLPETERWKEYLVLIGQSRQQERVHRVRIG